MYYNYIRVYKRFISGTFDFEGQRLLPFVQRCANYFLIHEVMEIRLEAVKTTSRLLRHAIKSATKSPSDTVSRTVADVLQKLLSEYCFRFLLHVWNIIHKKKSPKIVLYETIFEVLNILFLSYQALVSLIANPKFAMVF